MEFWNQMTLVEKTAIEEQYRADFGSYLEQYRTLFGTGAGRGRFKLVFSRKQWDSSNDTSP